MGTRAACVSVLGLLALYAALQAFVLTPDGFLSGDQGTKLLQTIAALKHGPFSPWIDGLSHDIDPEFRNQEPLLVRRPDNGRLVGIFPWILPALTAPFYGLLGDRGLYVVPAASVALTFLAACSLGRKLGTGAHGLWSGWIAVAATPVLFYGAEFWEHAPAVALTTLAIDLATPGAGSSRYRDCASGACIGLAATFRPEAAAALPAIWLARLLVGKATGGWRAGLCVTAGCAAVTALALSANHAVYGTIIPEHLSLNLGLGTERYLSQRGVIASTLLLPVEHVGVFVGAWVIFALLAILRRGSPTSRVALAHCVAFALIGVSVIVPLWRYAVDHASWTIAFGTSSVAHTWPFAVVLVYVLSTPMPGRNLSVERYLGISALALFAGIFLAMPIVGGAQWSARFLLPAAPPAAVLASSALTVRWSAALPRHVAASARFASITLLALSVLVQVYGLRWLAIVKALNANVARTTERLTSPGDVLISDLYWFPELSARLYSSRRLLFARSPADVPEIATRAAARGIRRFAVVTSAPETNYDPPQTIALSREGGVFVRAAGLDLGVRYLQLYWYELRQ